MDHFKQQNNGAGKGAAAGRNSTMRNLDLNLSLGSLHDNDVPMSYQELLNEAINSDQDQTHQRQSYSANNSNNLGQFNNTNIPILNSMQLPPPATPNNTPQGGSSGQMMMRNRNMVTNNGNVNRVMMSRQYYGGSRNPNPAPAAFRLINQQQPRYISNNNNPTPVTNNDKVNRVMMSQQYSGGSRNPNPAPAAFRLINQQPSYISNNNNHPAYYHIGGSSTGGSYSNAPAGLNSTYHISANNNNNTNIPTHYHTGGSYSNAPAAVNSIYHTPANTTTNNIPTYYHTGGSSSGGSYSNVPAAVNSTYYPTPANNDAGIAWQMSRVAALQAAAHNRNMTMNSLPSPPAPAPAINFNMMMQNPAGSQGLATGGGVPQFYQNPSYSYNNTAAATGTVVLGLPVQQQLAPPPTTVVTAIGDGANMNGYQYQFLLPSSMMTAGESSNSNIAAAMRAENFVMPPQHEEENIYFPRGQRCKHCDGKHTPMWRRGPDGRKSLCNACGIKHRKEQLRLEKEGKATFKRRRYSRTKTPQ